MVHVLNNVAPTCTIIDVDVISYVFVQHLHTENMQINCVTNIYQRCGLYINDAGVHVGFNICVINIPNMNMLQVACLVLCVAVVELAIVPTPQEAGRCFMDHHLTGAATIL